jgi:hypothetical protein
MLDSHWFRPRHGSGDDGLHLRRNRRKQGHRYAKCGQFRFRFQAVVCTSGSCDVITSEALPATAFRRHRRATDMQSLHAPNSLKISAKGPVRYNVA